jgi:hypothetical protein
VGKSLCECEYELQANARGIKLRLRAIVEDAPEDLDAYDAASNSSGHLTWNVRTITVPWTPPMPDSVKGIIHVPAHNTPIKPDRREALLIAIAKARRWIDDLTHGRVASFAAIARREGKVERHIRLLAPLAFLSPRIVSALLNGTAPADLTLTRLTRALPYSWAEQEQRVKTFTRSAVNEAVNSLHHTIGERRGGFAPPHTAPCKALGKSVDLIVIAPGKSQ